MVSLGEPNIYHQSVCFTRMLNFSWRVSDCEEFSGRVSQEMTGAGVRVSFLVLSFSTTNYHNPN
ncbi:MAG TPA: hypothetical protein EYQ48_00590, partial [Candidatus Lambdaproteobacteria bacterium]|nr:hypothetical protein [Candidatus Lambdaproteobacteria bacterium]